MTNEPEEITMSTRIIEEIEHHITPLAEGAVPDRAAPSLHARQQFPQTQPMTRGCRQLPKKELHRRLWQIYEMAFTAANRAQHPQGEDTP
jgi:hypothetical protein